MLGEIGFTRQPEFHSPTSQYGQLTRRGRCDHLEFLARMREAVEDIASGRFADEWDAGTRGGHRKLAELMELHAGPRVPAFEDDLRAPLGPGAGRS